MDLLLTLAFWVLFVYLIYKWAESKGRNPAGYAIAAAIISPLVVGIVLLFVPKTLEKQAEEQRKIKELIGE